MGPVPVGLPPEPEELDPVPEGLEPEVVGLELPVPEELPAVPVLVPEGRDDARDEAAPPAAALVRGQDVDVHVRGRVRDLRLVRHGRVVQDPDVPPVYMRACVRASAESVPDAFAAVRGSREEGRALKEAA